MCRRIGLNFWPLLIHIRKCYVTVHVTIHSSKDKIRDFGTCKLQPFSCHTWLTSHNDLCICMHTYRESTVMSIHLPHAIIVCSLWLCHLWLPSLKRVPLLLALFRHRPSVYIYLKILKCLFLPIIYRSIIESTLYSPFETFHWLYKNEIQHC